MVLQACSTTTSLSDSAIRMSCWMAPTCAYDLRISATCKLDIPSAAESLEDCHASANSEQVPGQAHRDDQDCQCIQMLCMLSLLTHLLSNGCTAHRVFSNLPCTQQLVSCDHTLIPHNKPSSHSLACDW